MGIEPTSEAWEASIAKSARIFGALLFLNRFELASTSVPIRPRFGSEFPTFRFRPREQSGNSNNSLLFLDALSYSFMRP